MMCLGEGTGFNHIALVFPFAGLLVHMTRKNVAAVGNGSGFRDEEPGFFAT